MNMDNLVEQERSHLEGLIDELCHSGKTSLDETKLKEIKSICKCYEGHVKSAYEVLLAQLNKEHSEIRYSALQIVDALFQRSHAFRELLLDEFQQFYDLVLDTNLDEPLPPPRKAAAELKKLAAKTIKSWHDKFGADYKLLDLAFNYLKSCKKIDFVSFSHQTSAQRKHAEQQSETKQLFLNKKFTEYAQEMKDSELEIKSCVEQLERCINLLIPKEDQIFDTEDFNLRPDSKKTPQLPNLSLELDEVEDQDDEDDEEDSDDDDFVEVPSKRSKEEMDAERELEIKYLGFGDDEPKDDGQQIKVDLRFKENEDNQVVIEIMRGLYKELKKSYLVKLSDWIKNFTHVRNASTELKRAIEIKNQIQMAMKKFENLNLSTDETIKASLDTTSNELESEVKPGTSSSKSSSRENDEKERLREEKLKIAPIIELDEMEYFAPSVHKVETTHPLFQRREGELNDETVQQQSDSSRLVKKTFVGKFEPVKWACRAPLRNGKLCPRMDRVKCPLHGKIVARNAVGEIVNESDRIENERTHKNNDQDAAWQDKELIADINAATGQNLIADKEKKDKKRRKGSNLTSIKNEQNTSRSRLEKILLKPKNINKIGSILDGIERRRNYEKFHHSFSYALQS